MSSVGIVKDPQLELGAKQHSDSRLDALAWNIHYMDSKQSCIILRNGEIHISNAAAGPSSRSTSYSHSVSSSRSASSFRKPRKASSSSSTSSHHGASNVCIDFDGMFYTMLIFYCLLQDSKFNGKVSANPIFDTEFSWFPFCRMAQGCVWVQLQQHHGG